MTVDLTYPIEYGSPYSEATAALSEVPSRWMVALAGRGLVIDLEQYDQQSLPMLRPGSDQGPEPSAGSRSTEGYWTRFGRDWRNGAGQPYFDRPDSDRLRFRSSKGIVWTTEGELTLHYDTEQVDAATATNLRTLPVGAYLYKVEAQTLSFSTTGASGSWTDVTLTGITADITGATTDGSRVFVCNGLSVWRADAGASSAGAAWSSQDTDGIWYGNGRLLGSDANLLFELDASGVKADLMTHANSGFVYMWATAAPNGFYVAGTAGNRSELYHVGVDATDGSLAVPIIAAPWVLGETINCVEFYASFLFIGTSKGFRLAQLQGDFVVYGSLVLVPGGVRSVCFEDHYAWFTWSAYDATSTGLGLVDLGRLVDADVLVFAYGTDLMVAGSATVLDVARFGSKTYLALSGTGFYRQATNRVPTAVWKSGWITMDDVEPKFAGKIKLRHEPLAGSIDVDLLTGEGLELDCGSTSEQGSTGPEPLAAGNRFDERFELQLTVNRSALDATLAPRLTLWQLFALPTGSRNSEIILTVIVDESVEGESFRPLEVYAWLKSLERAQQPVLYQEGSTSYTVLVDKVRVPKPAGWRTIDGVVWFDTAIVVRLVTLEV